MDEPRNPIPEEQEEELTQPRVTGRHREAWVGLFVIVGIVAVIGILFTFTDAAMFRNRYMVVTNVEDAGGIRRGDPVRMRGVNVGRVMGFEIVPTGGVDVRLEIEGEYGIPKDSRVRLVSAGLIGGMMAVIIPGTSSEMIGYYDRLPGSTEVDIASATEQLANQASQVLNDIDTMLSEEMVANVQGSASEAHDLMRRLSATTAEQRDRLRALTASLQRSAEAFEPASRSAQQAAESAEQAAANVRDLTARPELSRAVERLDTLTAKMNEATDSLDRAAKSMEQLASRMDRGEGTLGKLSRDDALYNNMNETVVSLRQLAEDIRKQPKRYFDVSVF